MQLDGTFILRVLQSVKDDANTLIDHLLLVPTGDTRSELKLLAIRLCVVLVAEVAVHVAGGHAAFLVARTFLSHLLSFGTTFEQDRTSNHVDIGSVGEVTMA